MSNQQIFNGTGNFVATDDVSRDGVAEKVQVVEIGRVAGASTLNVAPVDGTYGMAVKGVFPWQYRNPKRIIGWFDQGDVGPHSNIQRLLYTVPAGREAMLVGGFVFWVRQTAATTLGPLQVELGIGANNASNVFKVDGAGNVTAAGTQGMDPVASLYRGWSSADNTPGATDYHPLQMPAWLAAGMTVFANSYDASTGGTSTFRLSFLVIEYDA